MAQQRTQNKSYFANQVIERIMKAAETCDPEAINDFFSIVIDSNIEHLNIIDPTLSADDLVKRQRAIAQGTILLALFNHFALQQRFGEITVLSA
jgi:hypothetical protein